MVSFEASDWQLGQCQEPRVGRRRVYWQATGRLCLRLLSVG